MLIRPDCIPCILTMTMKAIRKLSLSDMAEKDLFSEILTIPGLQGLDWNKTSPDIIETVMTLITKTVHEPDPFLSEKTSLNTQALKLLPFLETLVAESEDPLYTAAKIAILGNSMDVMVPEGLSSLEKFILEKIKTPLSKDDFDRFCRLLSKAGKILYFTDNAGEIVFDRLFIQTLKRCSKTVRDLADGSDLIISKGGGNFDSLSEEVHELKTPVIFMLLSKCHPLNVYFKTSLHQPVMTHIYKP